MIPCSSNTVLGYIGNVYYAKVWSLLNIGSGLTELHHNSRLDDHFILLAGILRKQVVRRWNFFGSGHGKGEHDGAGVVIKWALTHEQLKAYAAHMCNTCSQIFKN